MYNNTIKAPKPSSIHSHELASWSFNTLNHEDMIRTVPFIVVRSFSQPIEYASLSNVQPL